MAKKLGILVNTDKNLEHLVGICDAAERQGVEVSIFVMDDGCSLTRNQKFLALAKKNVKVALCDHSYREKGFDGRVGGIAHGSQFDHVTIAHECDRFLVL